MHYAINTNYLKLKLRDSKLLVWNYLPFPRTPFDSHTTQDEAGPFSQLKGDYPVYINRRAGPFSHQTRPFCETFSWLNDTVSSCCPTNTTPPCGSSETTQLLLHVVDPLRAELTITAQSSQFSESGGPCTPHTAGQWGPQSPPPADIAWPSVHTACGEWS